MKAYTGIGSRETPLDIIGLMGQIARILELKGYILRSGGAGGADTGFEMGVVSPVNKEIYLPWNGFNGLYIENAGYLLAHPDADRIAITLHPCYTSLTRGAKKLHDRNVCQVLGKNLNDPSDFLICWTPDAADGRNIPTSRRTGGTATAINLAVLSYVEVFNLKNYETQDRIIKGLKL